MLSKRIPFCNQSIADIPKIPKVQTENESNKCTHLSRISSTHMYKYVTYALLATSCVGPKELKPSQVGPKELKPSQVSPQRWLVGEQDSCVLPTANDMETYRASCSECMLNGISSRETTVPP